MANPYGGMKVEGIAWLKRKQRVVEEAASVLVLSFLFHSILHFPNSSSAFRRPPCHSVDSSPP
jgi:hypothetical protein